MSIIASIIPAYKKVRAIKTYQTRAIMPYQGNKEVDFTIYKDSVYNVVQKNGDYQILMGPFQVNGAPIDLFVDHTQITWVPELILVMFFLYSLSFPFWFPKVVKMFSTGR